MKHIHEKEQKAFTAERELDQIFKGKYDFTSEGKSYSTENFIVLRDNGNNHYIYISDIHSSVSTGEFLKIKVIYEVTANFDPFHVAIIKSMGKQTTTEHYKLDPKTKDLIYTFENPSRQSIGKIEKTINGKFQISTPAFLPSIIITVNKKIESVGRTKVNFVATKNTWRHSSIEFTESEAFLEAVTIKDAELNINGKVLYYSLFVLHQHDVGSSGNEDEVLEFYVSKHLAIPYKAVIPGNVEIIVKNLVNTETPYKGMF
ncbi:hypothetical protein N9N67_04260 [Bacteriovoracaceae bacterium]|nr:hypothetical protein [Bacteriovoracaceae bacterium]